MIGYLKLGMTFLLGLIVAWTIDLILLIIMKFKWK